MRLSLAVLTASLSASALMVAGCSGSSSTPKKIDAGATVQAGVAELTAGHGGTAEGLFKKALAVEPGNLLAHYNLGVIYQQAGKTDQALREYGSALDTDPKYVPALFNSATIYGTTDPTLAVSTYRRVIALKPQAATAFLNLGLLEISLKMQQQGVKDLEAALRLDPSLVSRLDPTVKAQVGRQVSSETATPTPSPTSAP